jgi:membrane-associated protein
MNLLLSQFLTLVLVYGYPIIGISVFMSSVGFPFPANIITLAAGSLAALGDLNIFILFFVVIICSILGDMVDYWIGANVGYNSLHRYGRNSFFSLIQFKKIQKYYLRWTGTTIFLTRWLFSLFASITSILAGISKYSFRRFLIFDILGQIVSAIIFLGIGYLFSIEWQNIWLNVQNILLLLAAMFIGAIFIIIGIKYYRKLSKMGKVDIG